MIDHSAADQSPSSATRYSEKDKSRVRCFKTIADFDKSVDGYQRLSNQQNRGERHTADRHLRFPPSLPV